ncbi:MAG: hypothetical protein ABIR17_09080 [Pseudolysinimonas sp.]|uniref:hypothetical protein n=1 Tax=Pseudolysinimonas sp. TaxID=2680009 RepID=UPI003265107A
MVRGLRVVLVALFVIPMGVVATAFGFLQVTQTANCVSPGSPNSDLFIGMGLSLLTVLVGALLLPTPIDALEGALFITLGVVTVSLIGFLVATFGVHEQSAAMEAAWSACGRNAAGVRIRSLSLVLTLAGPLAVVPITAKKKTPARVLVSAGIAVIGWVPALVVANPFS